MAIEVDLNKLTIQEKMQLLSGISLEAAEILKKLFPNEPIIDRLIQLKNGMR
jgi:hypothetical protein